MMCYAVHLPEGIFYQDAISPDHALSLIIEDLGFPDIAAVETDPSLPFEPD